MDAFIVIKGTTTGVVVARFATQAEATAHAATDNSLTAITGAQTMAADELVGAAYYDGTTVHPEKPATSAEEIALRRETLYAHLRRSEDLEQLAVWGAARRNNVTGSERAGVADQNRYASYGRWVEANTRAAMDDANLTDDRSYDVLMAECAIPGETWYWLHEVSSWYSAYENNDRSQWLWHRTTGSSTEPNSRRPNYPARTLLATVTAAVAAGADTIEVDSTEGFPATGSLAIEIALTVTNIRYTGKTATSFTGCTGTPALSVGDTVRRILYFFLTLDTTGDWVQALR